MFYTDEAVIVNHALGFGTGDLNPHYFIYPTLYMYVLFAVYGVGFVAARLAGLLASVDDVVRLFFTDPTVFYLTGRLIAAGCGVASVALTYVLGSRAYDRRIGIVAAAFLAVSPLHVVFSHYVKTHVPAGLLVGVALLLAWDIARGRGEWRRYVAAGAAAGAAASTVYHAGFVIVSIAVAHAIRERRLDWRLIVAGAAAAFIFVAGTPFALLDWRTFAADLRGTSAVYLAGDVWVRGALFPFTSLTISMGPTIGVLALVGLVTGLVRRRPADLVLVSYPLTVGAFLTVFPTKESHHMLVAFIPLAIVAGSAVVEFVDRAVATEGRRTDVIVAAAVAMAIVPARAAFEDSRRLALPDTRTLAEQWVAHHIAPGSSIVMDSGKYYLSAFGPALPMSRRTVERLASRTPTGPDLSRRDGTRRVGYTGESTYFREQRRFASESGYDIVQVLHDAGSARIDVRSLEAYKAEGVQYAIVSSFAWNLYVSGAGARDAEKTARYCAFYDALRERGVLLQEFTASEDVAGPTLRIYRIL